MGDLAQFPGTVWDDPAAFVTLREGIYVVHHPLLGESKAGVPTIVGWTGRPMTFFERIGWRLFRWVPER